jgi:hypothetical protein
MLFPEKHNIMLVVVVDLQRLAEAWEAWAAPVAVAWAVEAMMPASGVNLPQVVAVVQALLITDRSMLEEVTVVRV